MWTTNATLLAAACLGSLSATVATADMGGEREVALERHLRRRRLVESSLKLAETRTSLADQRTELARERTFAAWLRTTLAYIGGGLALAKVGWERQDLWVARAIALVLVTTGALIHAHSVRSAHHWYATEGQRGKLPWLLWVLFPVGFIAAAGAIVLVFA